MEKGLLLVAFISCIWLPMGACAPALKQTRSGEMADPYYRPKRVYALEFHDSWDLTLKALNREGIPLHSSNKETGFIRTDYENVSSFERNRCDLRFSPEARQKTYIHILCRREARQEMGEPFKDLTYTSPLEAMKAEENLYRKIEPPLLALERSRAQQEVIARGEIKPPAHPPAPAPALSKAGVPPVSPLVHTEIEPIKPFPGSAEIRTPPSGNSNGAAPEISAPVLTTQTGPEKKPETVYLRTVAPSNARMAPSTQGRLVTVLNQGEKTERVGTSGMWTKVRLFSGEIVWIHSDFLQEMNGGDSIPGIFSAEKEKNAGISRPVNYPAAAQGKVAAASRVKPESAATGMPEPANTNLETKAIAKMRAEPSPASKVVLVLKKGRRVEKIGESGKFSKVKLSWGDTGWVLTRFLKNQ